MGGTSVTLKTNVPQPSRNIPAPEMLSPFLPEDVLRTYDHISDNIKLTCVKHVCKCRWAIGNTFSIISFISQG
jgi:hypothetical protein